MRLYAYASGQLEMGPTLPDGALPVARGRKAEMQKIQQRGRLAYDGETWLVPGIPEAEDQLEGLKALQRFIAWAVKHDRQEG